MTIDIAVELGQSALMQTLMLCAPPLVVAAAVGLVMSILQAVTQLHDQTIGFVPKLLAVIVVLALTLPWMCEQMSDYMIDVYRHVQMH